MEALLGVESPSDKTLELFALGLSGRVASRSPIGVTEKRRGHAWTVGGFKPGGGSSYRRPLNRQTASRLRARVAGYRRWR